MADGRLDRSSGRFWVAGAPEGAVGGWLDVSQRWPSLDLAETLTPALREVSRSANLATFVPADDDIQPDTVTVHGMARDWTGRTRVTLVDAYNTGRSSVWGGVIKDPGAESMRAAYTLVGDHLSGSDVRFRGVRLQLRHLDDWAQLHGIALEIKRDGTFASLTHESPPTEKVRLAEPAGWLALDTVLTAGSPTVRGSAITRSAELEWTAQAEGLTVVELWGRLILPLADLLTLTVDAPSPAISVQVRETNDGRWLRLIHPEIEPASEVLLPHHKLLLWREHVTMRGMGRWLSEISSLAPIPRLVVGVIAPSRRPVETRLLELAAAAEGLHRRLLGEHRVMSRGQAKSARRKAKVAVPEEVRERVGNALSHLTEPTYRERLQALVERAAEAAPGVSGDTKAWGKRIADARNGFAHQLLVNEKSEVQVEEHLVLMLSLRWLLTTLLLCEAGVRGEAMRERLAGHPPYGHFLRQAQRWMPDLYAPAPGKGSTAAKRKHSRGDSGNSSAGAVRRMARHVPVVPRVLRLQMQQRD